MVLRNYHAMKKIAICLTCMLMLIVLIFHPDRHSKYYTFIAIVDTYKELFFNSFEINKNVSKCSADFYKRLIESKREAVLQNIYVSKHFISPAHGGEYANDNCNPMFSVAIIVPYRNRTAQLQMFVNYMHYFLQEQKVHYRLFIVEQSDRLPFNRAKMMNVGALVAMKMNYSCLILHDVDLLPLNLQNIYACSNKPRHMSSSIDTFRYNLPYLELCGGVLSIQSSQFRKINGMSNFFYGWGGEDDDLFKRLQKYDLTPDRLSPEVSVYTMILHKKEMASATRLENLKYSTDRQETDGLNTIGNNHEVHLKSLYTHILVF
ncbi:beta-1,4-galactosyltransferase 6-like isoform X2 [Photinus pyralis]|uniref:beta-1,4-galactosyltransferase 6-like isoform X2 n=1 Tax=Photinus pyralis TaxID=7054 RepID=UPI001266F960|nr:beta-1,4-galactosyltransferase 6-like isoform X2 [Photinus pyralis]